MNHPVIGYSVTGDSVMDTPEIVTDNQVTDKPNTQLTTAQDPSNLPSVQTKSDDLSVNFEPSILTKILTHDYVINVSFVLLALSLIMLLIVADNNYHKLTMITFISFASLFVWCGVLLLFNFDSSKF